MSAPDFHILAPIPRSHLGAAYEVCEAKKGVYFAANTVSFFEKIDFRLRGASCPVWIYASDVDDSLNQVTWGATYIKSYRAIDFSGAEYLQKRPKTTHDETGWVLYWEVKDLHKLKKSEYRLIESFRGEAAKKNYVPQYSPRKPHRVLPV